MLQIIPLDELPTAPPSSLSSREWPAYGRALAFQNASALEKCARPEARGTSFKSVNDGTETSAPRFRCYDQYRRFELGSACPRAEARSGRSLIVGSSGARAAYCAARGCRLGCVATGALCFH